MKILIISKYFYPKRGGIEEVVHKTAKELVKNGIGVTVIASDEVEKKEVIDGINVIRVPTKFSLSGSPISPGIFLEIIRNDFDVCDLNEPNPFSTLFAFLALSLKNKPYVISYHSDITRFSFLRFIKWFYVDVFQRFFLMRGAKKIMPTSPNYINNSDILPYFKEKIVVIPNFVEVKNEKISNVKHKDFRLLFVGRLIYYKGLEYLIRAMPLVAKEIKNVKLIMFGDGQLKEELKKLANELDVEKYIVWCKNLSDEEKIKEYKKCDIFILPSIYKSEAFGVVQLEAMIYGKPLISTNIEGSGVTFVNKNNETGIVIPPKDPEALKDAIVKLWKDKKLRTRYGKNGRKRVEKYFSSEKISKDIINVYKEITDNLVI